MLCLLTLQEGPYFAIIPKKPTIKDEVSKSQRMYNMLVENPLAIM